MASRAAGLDFAGRILPARTHRWLSERRAGYLDPGWFLYFIIPKSACFRMPILIGSMGMAVVIGTSRLATVSYDHTHS